MADKMKLSDAIRKGAKLRPQGFGNLFVPLSYKRHKADLGSCAIGAACEAIDPDAPAHPTWAFHDLKAKFPVLSVSAIERYQCPVTRCLLADNLFAVITHMNDTHQRTREVIADWVATIEQPTA